MLTIHLLLSPPMRALSIVHVASLSSLKTACTWKLLRRALIKSSLCTRHSVSTLCALSSHSQLIFTCPTVLSTLHVIQSSRPIQLKLPNWWGWRGPDVRARTVGCFPTCTAGQSPCLDSAVRPPHHQYYKTYTVILWFSAGKITVNKFTASGVSTTYRELTGPYNTHTHGQ